MTKNDKPCRKTPPFAFKTEKLEVYELFDVLKTIGAFDLVDSVIEALEQSDVSWGGARDQRTFVLWRFLKPIIEEAMQNVEYEDLLFVGGLKRGWRTALKPTAMIAIDQ